MKEPTSQAKPTLSLCMIVKDEERYLDGCLQSVQDVADELVVVDTGSSDRTVDIAERYGAKILHYPWGGDFSAARNVSLAHATCDWILVLDADERLDEATKQQLRPLMQSSDVAGYSLICENLVGEGHGDQSQRAPVFRLFRNRPDIRFEGMIHEQALPSAKQTGLLTVASSVVIRHLGYMAEEVSRRDKRQRNLIILERQVTLEPSNPFVRFNLAEVLKLLGRREEAEREYRESLGLLKTQGASHAVSYYANVYFSLGDLYRELRRFEDAHAILDEAIAHYPTFADLYYTKGFTYFDAGRYPEAIAQFERCPEFASVTHPFAADPAIPGHKAFRALADCWIKLEDREQSKYYLERTLSLHPNPDAALFTNLGILLLEDGKEDEGLAHFEAALVRDREDLRAWLNLLLLTLQRAAYGQLTSRWSERPADPYCQALMALAFALSDRPLPVDRPTDEALVATWCEAVEVAITSDRTDMIQHLLDRLDYLGAQFPMLEYALGLLFLRLRLDELALGALLRAQQRHPDDPKVYQALGDVSLAAGRPEEADAMYARARELDAPSAAASLPQTPTRP